MKKPVDLVRDWWQPVLIFVAGLLIFLLIFTYRLGSLTGHFSNVEVNYIHSTEVQHWPWQDPVFAPHRLMTFGLRKAHLSTPAGLRLVSVFISMTCVLCGLLLFRQWNTRRVAILAGALLIASSWLLNNSRIALPEVMFLMIIPIVWLMVSLDTTKFHKLTFIALICGVCLTLYVPGLVWLWLIMLVVKWRSVIEHLKQIPWWLIMASICLVAALVSPIVVSTMNQPSLLLVLAGLPVHLPNLSDVLHNSQELIKNLFFISTPDPVLRLGRLPVLDIFTTILVGIGAYSLRYHLKLARTKLMLACIILFSILYVLGGPVTLIALLPFIYLLATSGLAFLLQQWFTVFPRNTLAQTIGTTLISVVVLLTAFYHINKYFIAWPQAPATRQAFSQHL